MAKPALSEMDSGRSAPWNTALVPLSWIYGGLTACRRWAYSAGLLRQHHVGAPVISVGGLSLGGSGKTPVTRFIANQFTGRGIRVGVVHGAYHGQAHRCVSHIKPSLRWQIGAARRFGDEAVMLAGWLGDAIVTCGADKLEAARLAVRLGAELIVVDDGFQHLRLGRDLDILVRSRGGDVRPLPAGPGRESFAATGHADLLWVVNRGGDAQNWDNADIVSSLQPRQLISADGTEVGKATDLSGCPVFLLAGIARPHAFMRLVSSLGARIVGHSFTRDHCPFTRVQFRTAARSGAELVLCTEKDAVRMWGHAEASALTALTCVIEITRGSLVLEQRLTATVQRTIEIARDSIVLEPQLTASARCMSHE